MKCPKKLIENLANEFWEMRLKFKDDSLKIKQLLGPFDEESDHEPLWFDYPNYYGLSYKVYSRLSGDFVDSLQGEFFGKMQAYGLKEYKKFFRSKKDLHRHIIRIWKIYGLSE